MILLLRLPDPGAFSYDGALLLSGLFVLIPYSATELYAIHADVDMDLCGRAIACWLAGDGSGDSPWLECCDVWLRPLSSI